MRRTSAEWSCFRWQWRPQTGDGHGNKTTLNSIAQENIKCFVFHLGMTQHCARPSCVHFLRLMIYGFRLDKSIGKTVNITASSQDLVHASESSLAYIYIQTILRYMLKHEKTKRHILTVFLHPLQSSYCSIRDIIFPHLACFWLSLHCHKYEDTLMQGNLSCNCIYNGCFCLILHLAVIDKT